MARHIDSRKTPSRIRTEHFLFNTSVWSIYVLSGLLLGIAILLSSCAVYPAYPAAPGPGPAYYQPYYVGPYYYPHYAYGPRYGYYYGCRWHCW